MMGSKSAINDVVCSKVMVMIVFGLAIVMVSGRPDSDFGFPVEHEGPLAQQNAQVSIITIFFSISLSAY